MSKIKCLKNVFLMIASVFLAAGCSNLSGVGNENLNQNSHRGGTKVYTISGSVGFSGAVPSEIKEKFFDDINQNGTNKSAYAKVPTENITIKVWAENENPEISNLDAVISANKKTFTISLTEGSWKFFGKIIDGDGNLIMTYSDKNFVPINEDNESYSPIIKLAPSKNGTGYVKLAFKVSDGLYDKVSCKFNGTEYVSGTVSDGELYFNGTGFSADYTQTAVAAGTYETVFYFWKNDVIAYQILQTINVYNNMTTDSWIGNEKYFKSGKIELDEEMLKKFVLTNIYVGSGSGRGNGTYYEPYTDLKYAFDSIKVNAELVKEYIEDDPGSGWYESEFHIWIKDTVNQKKNIDFEMFSDEMDSFVSVYVYVSSNDDQIKRIDCSGCSKESDFLKLSSDVLNINFSNLNFYNCRKGICVDCGGLEINNCSFTGSDTTIQKYAVKLCYVASGDYGTFLNMSGKTYFEKNYPICIEHNCVVYLTESFDFSRNDLIANIKVAQGTETNPGEYSAAVPNVLLNESIISSYSEVDEQFKSSVSKFKILNFWYDFEYVYHDSYPYYKLVPCYYVSENGSSNNSGSISSPFDFNTAIDKYHELVGTIDGVPVAIKLAAGIYETEKNFKCKYDFKIDGAGKTAASGTLIKYSGDDTFILSDYSYYHNLSISNLCFEYTGNNQINKSILLSTQGKNNSINMNLSNVEIFNCKNSVSGTVLNNTAGYSTVTLDNVYMHDCETNSTSALLNGCISCTKNLSIYNSVFENCGAVSTDSNGYVYGGVIYFAGDSSLTIKDTEIKNCYCKSNGSTALGGAIYYSGTKVDGFKMAGKNLIYTNTSVTGSAQIEVPSNIYLAKKDNSENKKIQVTESLKDSQIGISTELEPVLGIPVVFTSGYGYESGFNKGINPSTYFMGDSKGVVLEPTGTSRQACLAVSGGTFVSDVLKENIKITANPTVIQFGTETTIKINFTKDDEGFNSSIDNFDCKLFCDGKEINDGYNFDIRPYGTSKSFNLNILDSLPEKNYELVVSTVYNGKLYSTSVPLLKNSINNVSLMYDFKTYEVTSQTDFEKACDLIREGRVQPNAIIKLETDCYIPSGASMMGDTESTCFQGVLDGNGHTITIKNQNPLFGYAKGTIKNLKLRSEGDITGYVYSSSYYTGAFVAKLVAGNSLTISNCVNYANVSTNTSKPYAAGFVGCANSSDGSCIVESCINYGNILNTADSANAHAYGIVGDASIGYYYASGVRKYKGVSIKNCSNFGNISSYNAAGITKVTVNISNCANYGNITCSSNGGGLVLEIDGDESGQNRMSNCINYGVVNKKFSSSKCGKIASWYGNNSGRVIKGSHTNIFILAATSSDFTPAIPALYNVYQSYINAQNNYTTFVCADGKSLAQEKVTVKTNIIEKVNSSGGNDVVDLLNTGRGTDTTLKQWIYDYMGRAIIQY